MMKRKSTIWRVIMVVVSVGLWSAGAASAGPVDQGAGLLEPTVPVALDDLPLQQAAEVQLVGGHCRRGYYGYGGYPSVYYQSYYGGYGFPSYYQYRAIAVPPVTYRTYYGAYGGYGGYGYGYYGGYGRGCYRGW